MLFLDRVVGKEINVRKESNAFPRSGSRKGSQ